MSSKSKIIVALDTNNFDIIKKLIKKIYKEIYGVKIGYQFFFNFQSEGINLIKKYRLKIFFDFKLHDIPNTVGMGIQAIKKFKPDMITVHISGGNNMLKFAKKECKKIKLIGVTALTSLDDKDISKIYNRKNSLEFIKDMTKISLKNNLDGIVCSPNEIKFIKKYSKNKLKIITPGIRNKDNIINNDDQKRTMNAAEAIKLGANFLVIGRPILKSKNPLKFIRIINDQTN